MNSVPQDSVAYAVGHGPVVQEGTADTLPVRKPDTGRPFSVYRILQSLPEGATPAQQDSAVQAHLPVRKRFFSNRPDTLGIPGIKAKVPYRKVEDLPLLYRKSFFENTTYYHAEVDGSSLGMTADPLPYMLRRDDWVTGILLICFFFLMVVISSGKRFFLLQFKHFFFATHDREQAFEMETGREKRYMVFLVFQTSLVLGLLFFDYTQGLPDFYPGRLSPHFLLGIEAAVCLLYFGVKRVLYGFMNWIFFDRFQRVKWMKTFLLLTGLEGTLLFPLALVMVYFDMPVHNVGLCFLSILLLVKILMLYKAFSIFFRKNHGLLHLIMYFCALELVPLTALWRILVYITDRLIIKI